MLARIKPFLQSGISEASRTPEFAEPAGDIGEDFFPLMVVKKKVVALGIEVAVPDKQREPLGDNNNAEVMPTTEGRRLIWPSRCAPVSSRPRDQILIHDEEKVLGGVRNDAHRLSLLTPTC